MFETTNQRLTRYCKGKSVNQPAPERILRFIADDQFRLWKAGDLAEDLGWDSTLPESHPDFVPVRLLRKDGGEVLSITDPIRRRIAVVYIAESVALDRAIDIVRSACPFADPTSTHPITADGEEFCKRCEPFIAALEAEKG